MDFVWILMGFYGLVWILVLISMDLYEKKSNHKPIFDELGIKETYLVYWLCFGHGLVYCNPQLRNICIKEIFGL